MIELGQIPLADDRSILDARRKIRSLVVAARGSEVLATRLATISSQLSRALLKNNSDGILEIALCDHGLRIDLVLGFVGSLGEFCESQLDHFFDTVQLASLNGRKSWRGRVSLPISTISSAHVEQLRSIVELKTRDQLLEEIQTKNFELEESLDNLRRTRSAKDRMESELNIGRDIQMSMLPLTFPAFPEHDEFDIHAALYPAQEVGGDFYDMFMIDNDHLCFCVGDVSGKGVPAALFMAVTKTLIKSRAANDLSPASILSHVNTEQSEGNESCMFVTIFLAILDLHSGRLVYCNAGHNPPFVQRKDGALEQLDKRHGPVIGAMEGIAYGEDETVLEAGELAYFYTDGITEAMDPERNLYSDQRLEQLLAASSYTDAKQAVTETVNNVWGFQGDAPQADDITVLALRYQGVAAVEGEADLHLAISNQLQEIGRVNELFTQFAQEHGLPTDTARRMNICFDELLSNSINYGYNDDAEHEISIHIRLLPSELAVTITDDAKPFNPFASMPPDTRLPVEERPIGGLGLHLVKSFMDRVAYERHGEHNVVLLFKQIMSSNAD